MKTFSGNTPAHHPQSIAALIRRLVGLFRSGGKLATPRDRRGRRAPSPLFARPSAAGPCPVTKPGGLVARNSKFYDALWSKTYLTRPERFNTWPLISGLLPVSPFRLEIGPGLRPRLPVNGTHFLDLSPPAVERLHAAGGIARSGEITDLPYPDAAFNLVAAFDVVEHVEDDHQVFVELTRVLKKDGRLIFSVPLHPARWTDFDACVGHARRYEPAALRALLARHGLVVEKSAVFGMQSNNRRWLHYAVAGLTQHHSAAVRCYNWLFFPIGMLLQQRLKFADGLMDLTDVLEVLLVCRRAPRPWRQEFILSSTVSHDDEVPEDGVPLVAAHPESSGAKFTIGAVRPPGTASTARTHCR